MRPQSDFERALGLKVPSPSLTRDTAIITPRVAQPNSFLDQLDGIRGTNLNKYSTVQTPVYEQERFEFQRIGASQAFTTTGATVKWRIEPLDDECIEVYHITLLSDDLSVVWNVTLLTQFFATGGDVGIHQGRVTAAADNDTVLLYDNGGVAQKLNASNVMTGIPGSVVLCGNQLKPVGFNLNDVLTINSESVYTTAKTLQMGYLARRIPPPAAIINGADRITV